MARRLVLVSVALLGAVVASCGGGEEDSAPVTAPTSAASTPPAASAVDDTIADITVTSTLEPAAGYWDLLTVGSCFDNPASFRPGVAVQPVDCSSSHDNEIFADGAHPEGSGAFPGSDAISEYAFSTICNPAYEAFMGTPAVSPVVPFFAYTPTEAEWDAGDREIVCVVTSDTGLIGTVASAALVAPDVRLLHVSILDDQVDLYSTAQGEQPSQVTDDPEEEVAGPPSVSTDRMVYYARYPVDDTAQADIVRLDPGSQQITTLLATDADESSPRVSPDGNKIVYISNEGTDEFDVWVMGADGSNPTRLTTNPGRDANPTWSPDGSQIIYRASVDDNSDIWIMNADGSDVRQLTTDPAGDFDPVFSPDGSKIAFTSKRSGNLDIWVMDADGANPINVSNHPSVDEYPNWTSDGAGIAFTSDRFDIHIWLMRADGSEQTLFTLVGPSGYGYVAGPLG